jgi:hypothetical protein
MALPKALALPESLALLESMAFPYSLERVGPAHVYRVTA